MGPQSKEEYFEVLYKRYQEASRKEKTIIITECCAVCGYHRKHAIRRRGSISAMGAAHVNKPLTAAKAITTAKDGSPLRVGQQKGRLLFIVGFLLGVIDLVKSVLIKFIGVTVKNDLSRIQSDDARGKTFDQVHLMQIDNNGYAVAVTNFPQELHDFLAGHRIKTCDRLIGQQNTGLLRQRPGNPHALLLPAGKPVGPIPGAIKQTYPVECLKSMIHVAFEKEIQHASHPGAVFHSSGQDVGHDGQAAHEIVMLENDPHVAANISQIQSVDDPIRHFHLAACRQLQSFDHPEHGGFTRP